MQIPERLKTAIEKTVEGIPVGKLREISEKITEKYRENAGDGTRLVTDEAEAKAYAVVRMPATFCAVKSALTEARSLTGEDYATVLDVGAGTGAAVWAAADVCNVRHATCLEREGEMLKMGQTLTAETLCGVKTEWRKEDVTALAVGERYDLVSAAYVLNELSPAKRIETLKKLWDSTEKILLIVEPGTPAHAKLQAEIRTEMEKLGATLVAPCPTGAQCKMAGDDWCHFRCRVERTKLHKSVKKGDAPYEDEKFTYSAFYRGNSPTVCRERVLRRLNVSEKQVTLKVCSGTQIIDTTFRKKDGARYKSAKKADVGTKLS